MDAKRENQHKALCEAIEKRAGMKMKTSTDFDWLSKQIMDTVHQMVSANTLKRLWGYYEHVHVKTRKNVLDMLSQYLGYSSYSVFMMNINAKEGKSISDFVNTRHLETKRLNTGALISVNWQPDRTMTIEHLGDGRFIIREVENSKLCVGDTFECYLMIEGEPLFLSNLVHLGNSPMAYQAGKIGGIHFEILM